MKTVAEPITIASVYPWGRSFAEYRAMFAMEDGDLDGRIIGCADGPAAFNAEMAGQGKCVISCDPLYQFEESEIRRRIDATYPFLVEEARKNAARFVWDRIGSPQNMGRIRLEAMNDFLADYDLGRRQGRYVDRSLPELGFASDSFDLALCSHFLFLYSANLSLEFHVSSVMEMCRVAKEARIFPLLDMEGKTSAHLHRLIDELAEDGLAASIETVPYEFQRGGDQMLRVRRSDVFAPNP